MVDELYGVVRGKEPRGQVVTYKGVEMSALSCAKRLNCLIDTIVELGSIVNCRNCSHHDYDWFIEGDEFEVCKLGNHEGLENGFCKDWKEL